MITIQQNINFRVIDHLINLAAHDNVHPQVNAIAFSKLKEVKGRLLVKNDIIAVEMVRRIDRFLKAPEKYKISKAPIIPDGSPIGMDCLH